MNKTQVSKRMRELTIQIADLQAEFRAMLTEKTRLDMIKPARGSASRPKKRKTTKRKTATKRRKRRKAAKKA